MKAWKHFCTITHHKILVMKGCFKLGLYRQGLLHDMSKYSPVEFFVGCKYYQGTRSPNNAEREAKGYSSAWLHHKGRNKHHYEYWIDYGMHKEDGIIGMKMPARYVAEMFVDRISASKTYQKDKYEDWHPLQYYEKGAAMLGKMIHPETAQLLHDLLKRLARDGEEKTYAYTPSRPIDMVQGAITRLSLDAAADSAEPVLVDAEILPWNSSWSEVELLPEN